MSARAETPLLGKHQGWRRSKHRLQRMQGEHSLTFLLDILTSTSGMIALDLDVHPILTITINQGNETCQEVPTA